MSEYKKAKCPGCGVILTGAREPGDEDYCMEIDDEVVLISPGENNE